MINVTNVAYAGGAVANWVSDANPGQDNEPAFEAAIAAANAAGDEIYFPPGKYWVDKPIYKTGLKNLRFYGTGAVIICRGTKEESGINGYGGGFTLYGDNLIIDGLRFEGWNIAINTTTNGYGRLLLLNGDYNIVKNCSFKDGNGGAIEFSGNYNIITGNVFDKCNNYPVTGGDYGAIQVSVAASPATTKYNTVSENKIFGQFYSGICAYGPDANDRITDLDIINNHIKSNTSSASVNHSMGIYLIHGANERIKIIGNTIEKIDAEGIIISSASGYLSSKCVISNNIIKDCDYRGISLEIDTGGSFTGYIITDNIIENSSSALNYAQHIGMDTISDSIISNNKLVGVKNGSNYLGVGITFSNSCPRNQVCGNNLRTFNRGIYFYSPTGLLMGNVISDCGDGTVGTGIGIIINYCRGANVIGNIITSCTTASTGAAISYGSDAAPQLIGNSITDCTNNYSSSPPVSQLLTLSGISTSPFSNLSVTDQLSSGVKVVTFYHVFAGDRFLVVPNNESSDTQGALYVSLIDPTNDQVTVRSTLSTDSRYFTLIKILSGG